MLTDHTFVPKYVEVQRALGDRIASGLYPPGAKLGSESALVKEFGVSRITVIRALNELVREGLVYREKGRGTFVTRQMRKVASSKRLIATMCPCVVHRGVIARELRGMEDATDEAGYSLIMGNADDDLKKALRYADKLIEQGVLGVIFPAIADDYAYSGNLEVLRKLVLRHIPVVQTDNYCDVPPEWTHVDYVVTDNFEGARTLINHLITCGHRRIGLLRESFCTSTRDRINGYRTALEENGIVFDPALIRTTLPIPDYEKNGHATSQLLALEDRPTAIFALHDLIAEGVMQYLQRVGVSVPEEMALVGYDDLEFAAHLSVPLTTVRQPLIKEGRIAVETLIGKIEGRLKGPQQIVLESELIVRESCGAKANRGLAIADCGIENRKSAVPNPQSTIQNPK